MERVKYGPNSEYEDECTIEEIEDAAEFLDNLVKENKDGLCESITEEPK